MKIKTREITKKQMELLNIKEYFNSFNEETKVKLLKTAFEYYWWDFVLSNQILTKTLCKYDITKNIRPALLMNHLAEGWRSYPELEDEFLDIIMNICEFDIKALHCKKIAYNYFMKD